MRLIVIALLLQTLSQLASAQSVSRLAFGSCVHQDKEQPIWAHVLADAPDAFVFLGDNIYGDTDDPQVLADRYAQQMEKPGWQQLFASTNVYATWDDHDYGQNDIGASYSQKEASREIMLDFFGEPADSERRTRADGIYTSYLLAGDNDKTLQLVLLDLRWNKTPLAEVTDRDQLAQRNAVNRGPYEASLEASAELLGEVQFDWLEQQLQVDADVRVIASSIQLLAEFTGWESWANYPKDRQRFIELLEVYQQEPIVIISGDVHWAELSEIHTTANDWPLIELTSSGLTEEWTAISPNRHRVGTAFAEANYGLIDIDWSEESPKLLLRIKNEEGNTLIRHEVSFWEFTKTT